MARQGFQQTATTASMKSSDVNNAERRDEPAGKGGKTVRVFNWRLALLTLLVVAVLGSALYGWHRVQLQRTAQTFLDRADQLDAKQDWVASAYCMVRHLSLHPDDNAVRIRMTKTFDRGAKDGLQVRQAVNLYYQTLGLVSEDEEAPALRRRLTEMLVELRRYGEAEAETVKLLRADKNDAAAQRLLAIAIFGRMQSADAIGRSKGGVSFQDVFKSEREAFETALKSNPGNVQLSWILASYYRGKKPLFDGKKNELPRAERERMADALMDRMIKANPAIADAYLTRYHYRVQNRLAGSGEDLRTALKLGPDNTGVLLIAAEKAKQDGMVQSRRASLEEARGHYEHVLRIGPGDERCYAQLGEVVWWLGNPQEAVEIWRRGLKTANKDSILLHQCLAAGLVTLGRAGEASSSLDALDALIPLRGDQLVAAKRTALESSRDFVRARWWILKGDLAAAVPLLKRVVAQGAESSDALQKCEAWALLGRILSVKEEWDQAALAYERASLLLPRSAEHKLVAAHAWTKVSRFDKAIQFAEQALTVRNSAEACLLLADARYQQQAALPTAQRQWQPFRKALAQAAESAEKQALARPWRLTLLRAGALLAGAMDKSPDEARVEALKLLRAAENAYPKSAALLQSLPLAFERAGSPADADRALASLGKLPGQALPALLRRSELCLVRRQYAEARAVLKAGLNDLPSDRFQIGLALSAVSAIEGHPEGALQELSQMEKEFPDHPQLLRRLVEMAWDLGKTEESRRWEEKICEKEGANGFYARYYRAQRLAAEIADGKDKRIHEVKKLVDELVKQRPSSPGVNRLVAQIEQKCGNREQAIQAYRNAIRLGERRIEVHEQLTTLLYAEGRFAEAEECLAQLQGQVPLSGGLSGLDICLAAQRGNLDRALATARHSVKSRPKDPMAQIWLGKVLLATGQIKEAEDATRRAVEMAPGEIQTHIALLAIYLHTRQLDLAKKTLEELDRSAKASPAERAFAVAQGRELVCRAAKNDAAFIKKTIASYEEARRLNPDSVALLQRQAIFLLKFDPEAAEAVFRNIQASQKLIETSGVRVSADEQRVQAGLLANRGGKENLLRAQRILEGLIADSRESIPDDNVLLAQLLEAEGKTTLARQQFLAAVNRVAASPGHLAKYVEFLLRQDMGAEAAPWIDRLRQQLPDDLGVHGLYAQWLHNQRRDSEIEPAIEAAAKGILKKPSENELQRIVRDAQLSLVIGNLYAAAEQHAAAERWYRRLLKAAPRQYAPLAVSLGRQNRLREAAALCIEAAKSDGFAQPETVPAGAVGFGAAAGEAASLCIEAALTDHSARPAIVLASVLLSSKTAVDNEVFLLAEPLFAQALQSHAKDTSLLTGVADLRVLQQRTDEAVDLYRRVVSLRPKDIQALNNLATLLAEQPHTREEALRSIDEALKVAGPLPVLLDTKGTILVQDGRAQEAVPLLKEATVGAGVDPRFLFHLSLACQGAGKSDEARKALQQARRGKLTQQLLTPSDRRSLRELEQQLGM
jgi:tetratricopeptide (TPR) repeat protein